MCPRLEKKPKQDGISIRHFQPPDEQPIKDLFVKGILSTANAAFFQLCGNPPIVAIVATLVGLAGWWSGSLGVALMVAGLIGGWLYLGVRQRCHKYCSHSVRDDLSDIPQVYLDRGGCFLVAVDDSTGNIVGTVGGECKGANLFELRRMSVEEELRGRGLGGRLIQRLERECPPGSKIFLTTNSAMHAAQQLYRRNGFVVTRRFPAVTDGFAQYLSNVEIFCLEKQL